MTAKEKKSTVHLIIETLMSGDPLRSKEITDIISDSSGKTVKVQDVASMLSRITDADKCELGGSITCFLTKICDYSHLCL